MTMRIQGASDSFNSRLNVEVNASKISGGFAESLKVEGENIKKTSQDAFVYKTGRAQSRFSGTMRERFKQMEQINSETDWRALNDTEKVKLIIDRYRDAFSEFDLVMSGLYSSYISSYDEIGAHYGSEFDKYLLKGGEAPLQSGFEDCHREAYYGTCTDDELRTKIMDKYKGSNSMENKFLMVDEMRKCGLRKNGELNILTSIEMQIFSQVENANKIALYGTNMSISQNPRFLEMFMAYAKGTGEGKNYMPNWTQIIGEAKSMRNPDASDYELMGEEMDDFLDEILKR